MGRPRKPRKFHPSSIIEDREGAICLLGGQPWVLDLLIKNHLLRPIGDALGRAHLFDVLEIREAYVKARAKGLFRRDLR